MTGLSDSERRQGLECGGVDYMPNRFCSNELPARIRVHLANARLTQSAHSALDGAGQTLIATSPDGTLRWATQAHQLFEQMVPIQATGLRPCYARHQTDTGTPLPPGQGAESFHAQIRTRSGALP